MVLSKRTLYESGVVDKIEEKGISCVVRIRRGSRDFSDRCISLRSHTLRGGGLSSSGKCGNLGPQKYDFLHFG